MTTVTPEPELTEKQLLVMDLLVAGLPVKDIAELAQVHPKSIPRMKRDPVFRAALREHRALVRKERPALFADAMVKARYQSILDRMQEQKKPRPTLGGKSLSEALAEAEDE